MSRNRGSLVWTVVVPLLAVLLICGGYLVYGKAYTDRCEQAGGSLQSSMTSRHTGQYHDQ